MPWVGCDALLQAFADCASDGGEECGCDRPVPVTWQMTSAKLSASGMSLTSFVAFQTGVGLNLRCSRSARCVLRLLHQWQVVFHPLNLQKWLPTLLKVILV
jgi:hypothetical protein